MGGGLMQLVAYGAQDIYLTGNPQITFFKVVYRRHTNFSMEAIEQTFNGQADFGRKVTCTISRNGDLIHRVYLQVVLPAVSCTGSASKGLSGSQYTASTSCSYCFRWTNYIGHVLIRSVEVEIGGQRIDKHYGDWLNIWNELTQEPGKQAGYDNMVGNTVSLTGTGHNSTETTTLYIPLQFWFCRNPGLALPLIALQYHEVKINLEFRQKEETYITSSTVMECSGTTAGCTVCVPSLEQATLFVDYIYLDTDERRRFAQVSHEYLIEQLQFTGDESVTSTNVKVKLNFNHPCKELIWVVQRDDVIAPMAFGERLMQTNQWNNYTDSFDLDSAWASASPTPAQLLYTNVESGWSSMSFPSTYSSNENGTDTHLEHVLGGIPAAGGAGFTGSGSAVGTDSQWSGAVVRGLDTPAGFGPGAAGDIAPTNFGALTDTAQGSDHAGLGPLNAGRNPVMRAKLQLNGHDRFQERLGSYFNLVQPYQHHTNVPATGINVYSFALRPEEHQPSGTCNMSRIDNATLQLQLTPKAVGMDVTNGSVTNGRAGKLRVYATNYNVLRIMSGMGGLAYSN
jgi:hypothetical protein